MAGGRFQLKFSGGRYYVQVVTATFLAVTMSQSVPAFGAARRRFSFRSSPQPLSDWISAFLDVHHRRFWHASCSTLQRST